MARVTVTCEAPGGFGGSRVLSLDSDKIINNTEGIMWQDHEGNIILIPYAKIYEVKIVGGTSADI